MPASYPGVLVCARGTARGREKRKIRRAAPGKIRIQNGGSVFCRYSVFFILEIHACNNPSPVFKRCILSAVANTSSQGGGGMGGGGGGRLDRGGRGLVTKMFPDVQKIFRTNNNFSENTVVFPIHFLMS